MKRMNESYGIGLHGQFISEKAGWGPTFTSFPEDAKKFSSPKAAQKYIRDNELEDMGVSVVSLPSADDLDESRLKRIVAESVKKVLKESIKTGPYNQPIYSPRAPEGSDNGIEGYPDRSKMPKDLGKHPVVKHQWKNGCYDLNSPIVTLDDVPFEYLKDMVERFNAMKPQRDGFHGADDAWLEYWQDTLNKYFQSRQ